MEDYLPRELCPGKLFSLKSDQFAMNCVNTDKSGNYLLSEFSIKTLPETIKHIK